MFDILQLLPGKKRKTGGGWYSFNAVCCTHFGHNLDRRMRGGITINEKNDWSYNCFNCGFKCGFTIGRSITQRTKKLLSWCGCDEEQIAKWNIESLRNRDLLDFSKKENVRRIPEFVEKSLPENSVLLDESNVDHAMYAKYIRDRGLNPDAYPYIITPDETGRNKNRIIIPYFWNKKIVGSTSRYLDDKTPKYINDQQTGYLFGVDFQDPSWSSVIIVEGIFDALSINGCALTHNTIGEEQAAIISNLNRRVILVPDRDRAGLQICERALELGYNVSIPSWEKGVKDVNDAVRRYGKLPTLLSIMQNATSNKVKIELTRRKLLD